MGTEQGAPPRPRQRVHDVADLASGIVLSTSVARAPAAAHRTSRLARLGIRVDLGIFGSPTHRLTPQRPHQAAPEAWLDAFGGDYSSGPASDRVWWRLPATFPTEFMSGINFTFMGVPQGAAVLSLTFEAWPHHGRQGTVVVEIGTRRAEIPVAAPTARTADIAFVHQVAGHVDARVFWRPGIYDFVWTAAALGPGLPVLEPVVHGG
jgi:hypothetical protein